MGSGRMETSRNYSVLWKILVTGRQLIKKASPVSPNFTKSLERMILETEQKMYASFRRERGFHSMTVSEILRTALET